MADDHEREREIQALRERLSRLSNASLRINDSLDYDSVLQGVLESARSLTGALFGIIVLFDDDLRIEDSLISGLSPEHTAGLLEMPHGIRFFERTGGIAEPVRRPDFHAYVRGLGLAEFALPMPVSSPLPFLFAPIRYRERPVGTIYLGDREGGEAFTPEDEEALVMFASQAALVLANARYHRDEQRARGDLEALVNTAPVGVLVFNARSGVLVSFNRETRRIGAVLTAPRDVSPEEVVGMLTIRRADGREFSLQELPLTTALLDGETVRAEEIELSVPDGQSLTALLNATPIRSDDGEMESFVVTIQDLTPLEEMERLRAEFLGMVSHELRTPLTSIRGSANTLLDEESHLDPAEMRQFHRIIFEQSERMRSLIGDLLDMARIEVGNLSVVPAPAEVATLVDDARNTFLGAGGRDTIRIELPAGLPLVMADRRRIIQVVNNLLSNAARHSPDTSSIELTAGRQGVHVALSVVDYGRGITADRLPRLFRKFSKGAEFEDDTGLGLAICKGIVEAHGGRIWAESDGPGHGSRFTFTLPVAEGAAVGDGDNDTYSQTQPAQRVGTERARVLLVDDDPQTLRYVRDILSRAGYTPSVTADPEEVPRLVEEERPHLVLMDLMLPGTDGIELMKSMRSPAVPVIFLSAYGQDHVIARAFEMGAADYVVKPFSPTELVARIQAAIRRQGTPPDHDPPAEPYLMGDLVIDHRRRRVTVAGQPIELTDTEYRVLAELSANAGRIMTHEQLLRRVWDRDSMGGSGPVRAIVKRLRRKLGDDADEPTYIFTRRRVGYWMARADEQS